MPDFGLVTYGLFGSAVYIDTNVWSELAKGNLPPELLTQLMHDGNAYLTLGPFQMLELSRRIDLGHGLVGVFEKLTTCMAARSAKSELQGRSAWAVDFDFFISLNNLSPSDIAVWLQQFASGDIGREFDRQRASLISDRRWGIENFRRRWPPASRGHWRAHFLRCLDDYLQDRCVASGCEYRAERLRTARYYRGSKLHFALLYFRHYLREKSWEDSDLIDLLHAFEMAYASVIVTERSLATSLTQIRDELPELEVPAALSLADLRHT